MPVAYTADVVMDCESWAHDFLTFLAMPAVNKYSGNPPEGYDTYLLQHPTAPNPARFQAVINRTLHPPPYPGPRSRQPIPQKPPVPPTGVANHVSMSTEAFLSHNAAIQAQFAELARQVGTPSVPPVRAAGRFEYLPWRSTWWLRWAWQRWLSRWRARAGQGRVRSRRQSCYLSRRSFRDVLRQEAWPSRWQEACSPLPG